MQLLNIQAFLKGSPVVVSIPISIRKILIAEATTVLIVARGRKLLYTTPLKELYNQMFQGIYFQAMLHIRKLIKVNFFVAHNSFSFSV